LVNLSSSIKAGQATVLSCLPVVADFRQYGSSRVPGN
jgi:hypothetical protein